jgi:thiamine pyrophosphate-dependent acetolactate synthase large subunit-like protein
MRRAFHALRNGPAGPVVVEMTSDVCAQEVQEADQNYHSPKPTRQVPADEDIKDTVKALLGAENPVIWAGLGVLFSDAIDELKTLADLTGIPVFCTMSGKSAFDERRRLCMSGLDIETASRSKVPITTILLNNGGMATYPGGFPVAQERYGVSHMQGDYTKIAEGMGATGITVKKVGEMPALEEAQKLNADGKTVLIDVHSDMEGRRSKFA